MFMLQKLAIIAAIAVIVTFPSVSTGEAVESSSRCGLVSLDGDPLTLASEELQTGEKAPGFTLVNLDMEEVTEKDYKGKIYVISVMPSIDTPTWMSQIQWLAGQAKAFKENVVLINVSVDLPYALKRYREEKGIENAEFLSDYRDGNFGKSWGVLLEEIQLLARGLFIIDEKGTIRYVQVSHKDLFSESLNYEDIADAFNEMKLFK